ncbi:MAG: hypothetical protein K1X67_02165 [Fimbriimonadaceae bacterium]|nr:hypothetical protein [Fimbriimonadaceae bacterium]
MTGTPSVGSGQTAVSRRHANGHEVFALFCALTSLTIVGLRIWSVRDLPLGWDEVDYAQAAGYGVLANGMGTQELSALQFAALAGSRWGRPLDRVGLMSEEHETFFLRHFHPPVPVYYWSLARDPDPVIFERHLRVGQVLLACMALLLCAIALLATLGPGERLLSLGFLPILAVGPQPMVAFKVLSFHGPFSVTAVLLVAATVHLVQKPSLRWAATVGAAAGLCVATLETGTLLVALVVVATYCSGGATVLLRHARPIAAALTTSLLVIWPGMILTGGPLKSWSMYAYRVFLAGNREYQGVSPATFWTAEGITNPVLFAFAAIAAFVVVCSNGRRQHLVIPALVATGYGLFMTPFALSPSYVSPAFTLLWYAAAQALGEVAGRMTHRRQTLVWLCSLTLALAGLWRDLLRFPSEEAAAQERATASRAELELFKRQMDQDPRAVLLEAGHIPRFYLPALAGRIEPLHVKDERDPGYWIRHGYLYDSVRESVQGGRFACVGLWKVRPYASKMMDEIARWGAKISDVGSYRVGCFPAPK